MIDWIMDTSKGDQAIWESVNHTTINSVGLEVSAGLDFRQLLPSQSMLKSLKLSYSYIDQDKKQEANIVSQYALEYLRHKFIGNLNLQLAKTIEPQYLRQMAGSRRIIHRLRQHSERL